MTVSLFGGKVKAKMLQNRWPGALAAGSYGVFFATVLNSLWHYGPANQLNPILVGGFILGIVIAIGSWIAYKRQLTDSVSRDNEQRVIMIKQQNW